MSTFIPPKPSTQIAVTENTISDQPSSSNQALQPCVPINISSPPTLFLDSIILTYAFESIFKELNKLIKARNNFVHGEDYVKDAKNFRRMLRTMSRMLRTMSRMLRMLRTMSRMLRMEEIKRKSRLCYE
jgi:hypothetical protein